MISQHGLAMRRGLTAVGTPFRALDYGLHWLPRDEREKALAPGARAQGREIRSLVFRYPRPGLTTTKPVLVSQIYNADAPKDTVT